MPKAIEAWSPFGGLEHFRRDFDELVDRFFDRNLNDAFAGVSSPALESYVENGKLVVRADLPGIDPKEVEVTVTGDTLLLRGKRERKHEQKGRDFIHREVSYGSFERAVRLPEGVKADEVTASYKNGVLELTMPAPREVAARRVPIETDGGVQKQIEKG